MDISCRVLWVSLSQFFHKRLHLSNHPKERSTTHRCGITANLCHSFHFAPSTSAPHEVIDNMWSKPRISTPIWSLTPLFLPASYLFFTSICILNKFWIYNQHCAVWVSLFARSLQFHKCLQGSINTKYIIEVVCRRKGVGTGLHTPKTPIAIKTWPYSKSPPKPTGQNDVQPREKPHHLMQCARMGTFRWGMTPQKTAGVLASANSQPGRA